MSEWTDGALDNARRRARSFERGALPADAERVARHCVLDWFGCAVAGARTDAARIVRNVTPAHVGDDAAGLVGVRGSRSLADAALVNGVASHALDFDDLHPGMSAHAGVAILPALLAVGSARSADLEAVLAALVAGVEFGAEVGRLVGQRHYAEGWHTTGAVGAIAAAAAVAHLLRLDEDGWATATALASTMSGGLRAMFGSMAKPLHAGRAASAGVLAAQLAADGFTAARTGLTGPLGFVTMFASAHALPPSATTPAIAQTVFKLMAACTGTHASAHNAREALARLGAGPDAVSHVEVFVSAENQSVCGIVDPRSGTEAKFSIRTTTALAFLGWDLADESTYDRSVRAAEVRDYAERIHVRYTPELEGRPFFARTRVLTASGDELVVESDASRPNPDADEREAGLRRKFHTLVDPLIGSVLADRLDEAILTGRNIPVDDLVAMTRPETRDRT